MTCIRATLLPYRSAVTAARSAEPSHGLSGRCDENRQRIPIGGYIRSAERHERDVVGLRYERSRTSMSIDDSMWLWAILMRRSALTMASAVLWAV